MSQMRGRTSPVLSDPTILQGFQKQQYGGTVLGGWQVKEIRTRTRTRTRAHARVRADADADADADASRILQSYCLLLTCSFISFSMCCRDLNINIINKKNNRLIYQ